MTYKNFLKNIVKLQEEVQDNNNEEKISSNDCYTYAVYYYLIDLLCEDEDTAKRLYKDQSIKDVQGDLQELKSSLLHYASDYAFLFDDFKQAISDSINY